MIKQISINFEVGLTQVYTTCREFIAARIHQQSAPQKSIAADMDYSPSQLSRKLSQSPNDNARFTLDDLEAYIQTTGDTKPIEYLVEKYKYSDETDALKKQINDLQRLVDEKESLRAVG